MDMFDSLFSPSGMLNEQVARHVFDVLPDDAPVLIILDRQGNFWPSDSEKFNEMTISETFLRELCDRVDDGSEPLITKEGDFSLVISQLSTDRTNCGYVAVVLPSAGEDVAYDLAEIILNQVSLAAKLLEKNNLLYELQMKKLSEVTQNHPNNQN